MSGCGPACPRHVRLPVGTPHKALLVLAEAVRSDAGVNYLFVVSPLGVLERRVVTVGPDRDGKREVKKGLHADEWVVIQPPEKLPQSLRAGSTVEVEKVPMPEGPSSAQRGPQRDGAAPERRLPSVMIRPLLNTTASSGEVGVGGPRSRSRRRMASRWPGTTRSMAPGGM